MVNNHFI